MRSPNVSSVGGTRSPVPNRGSSCSDELDFDHLPDLVRRLASASLCTEYDREHCLAVARLAADHGVDRAREGFGAHPDLPGIPPPSARARRPFVSRSTARAPPVFYATMRLDALSGLASAAALHGLHAVGCPEREAGLHDALRQLLDEWPLPDS